MNWKREDYDTFPGILNSLSSYETFTEMLDERHRAGYGRKERMNTFYVLGRFYLDGCGNCGYATNFIPAENIPEFPQVALQDVFWQVIKDWQKKKQPDVLTNEEIKAPDFSYSENKRPFPISISFGMENIIPPTRLLCPHCGKKWEVKNCHDVRKVRSESLVDDKDTYIKKTPKEVREKFNKKTDAVYYIHDFIHNDIYIDKTPNEKYPDLVKNEHGSLDIDDDYVFTKGDKVFYEKVTYYHSECFIASKAEECNQHRKDKGKNYQQRNLAGDIACDEYIKLELELANIDIVEKKARGEVPYHYEGQLGQNGEYTFERAWYYWVVKGLVPLKLAKEMYADKEGKKSVRVAGHCGCPPPEKWAKRIDLNGKELCNKSELETIKNEKIKEALINDPELKWVDDKSKHGQTFVTTYHIDTCQGLKLFADTIKKYTDSKIRKIQWK